MTDFIAGWTIPSNSLGTWIPHTVSKYPRAHTSENSCLFFTALASAEIHKTGTEPERAQAVDRGRDSVKNKTKKSVWTSGEQHCSTTLLFWLYEESLVVSSVVMSNVCDCRDSRWDLCTCCTASRGSWEDRGSEFGWTHCKLLNRTAATQSRSAATSPTQGEARQTGVLVCSDSAQPCK